MFKIQKNIIEQHYDLKVIDISSLAEHVEAKVFLIETTAGKYVLKEIEEHFLNHPENEGELLEYLSEQNIRVAKILKNIEGEYITSYEGGQFHLQEFIKGEIISLNSAPDWYLEKSAKLLGLLQNTLINYKKLPILFDENFLSNTTVQETKQGILNQIDNVDNDLALIKMLNRRLEHLEKVSHFNFDISRLTYTNSHGDYYVNQTIVSDKDLILIDWTGACFLPACFEVIMSYSYADPVCKDGEIPVARLKEYLMHYSKYFKLSAYDIKMMPYFYYFQLATCNFIPPYNDLPDDYLQIALHCDRVMEWLFDNVEKLSDQLVQ